MMIFSLHPRILPIAAATLLALCLVWQIAGRGVAEAQAPPTPTPEPTPSAAWIEDPHRAVQIPVDSEEGVERGHTDSRSCRQHSVEFEPIDLKWMELHCYVRRVMEGMAVAGAGAATLGIAWGSIQIMADSGGGATSRSRGMVTIFSAIGGLVLILSAYVLASLIDAGLTPSLPFR